MLLPQPVDVRRARQVRVGDLGHGAQHHDLPVGMRRRHVADQVEVQPLVDHPVIAEARVRDRGLVGGVGLRHARLREVAGIDAGRKGVDVVVLDALCLVKAVAAGEDDIGGGEQVGLVPAQAFGGKAERRQFVHAVVDDRARPHMARDRPHLRGIEPQHRMGDAGQRQHLVQQARQRAVGFLGREGAGDARADGLDGGAGEGVELQIRQVVIDRDRLFPEDHAAVGGEAADQVLRALQHEVPAQV